MSNALFIDASNLNVLYKVNGKFCFGVSYFSCPEKLVTDAQALGSSFDVYVSIWPRQKGEGDIIVRGLSIGGVPFIALRAELEAVLNLVENIPRVNDIYFCNALANFAIPSRVANFQSLLCCGSRYALVTVSDRLLQSLKYFNSQSQFYDEMGTDFSCYGDMDIVDIDTLRAQYPELMHIKKNILVPLVPLIVSYHSAYKVSLSTLKLSLDDYVDVQEKLPPKIADSNKQKKIVVGTPSTKPTKTRTRIYRKESDNFDALSFLFSIIACVAMFITGIGYSFSKVDATLNRYSSTQSVYVDRTKVYNDLVPIYQSSPELITKATDVLSYAKSSGMDLTVVGCNIYFDRIVIEFNANSAEIKDYYREYLASRFVVYDIYEFESQMNTDGTVTIRYGVTIVL